MGESWPWAQAGGEPMSGATHSQPIPTHTSVPGRWCYSQSRGGQLSHAHTSVPPSPSQGHAVNADGLESCVQGHPEKLIEAHLAMSVLAGTRSPARQDQAAQSTHPPVAARSLGLNNGETEPAPSQLHQEHGAQGRKHPFSSAVARNLLALQLDTQSQPRAGDGCRLHGVSQSSPLLLVPNLPTRRGT